MLRKIRVSARSFRTFVVAGALGLAAALGCSTSPESGVAAPPPGVSSEAPPVSPQVAPEPGPTRAPFGLDARPPNPTCKAPTRPPPPGGVTLERAFANVTIERPMVMAQPPGDASRWFVAQRDGVIVSFAATSPPAQPTVVARVASLSGRPIRQDFEGGFLGMVFHPDFANNGRVYVSFTTDGAPYASEVGYLTTTDGGASFQSYTKVFGFDRPKLEHCGGGMAFGKDRYLYLGFGEGTMPAKAQAKDNPFGKVLRIDVDHAPAGKTFGIPPQNPFAAGGGDPTIFASGFRNPFRISIDRDTGELWVGDVGDSTWEEINRVAVGANHGWPCREGARARAAADPTVCPTQLGFVDPVVEHEHTTPNSRSITGGIVYRGAAMPSFRGTYVYADFIRLEAWALSFDATSGEAKSVLINSAGPHAGFSAFAEDANGEIYALATFQNSFFKLVSTGKEETSTFPEKLSQTGCVDPANPKSPIPAIIPYGVNAALWSDGADKDRGFALPDGATVEVKEGGRLELPVGSVIVKTFRFGDRRLETRLMVRHDDGEWAGYTYEWDEAQTDATLLASGKTVTVGDRTWSFPSRTDCVRCHTAGAGRTLGLEVQQLDGEIVYASTSRVANQLATLEHIGVLRGAATRAEAYPDPFGGGTLEARARAYLHANCAGCHRPDGGAARAALDLRFQTPLRETKACGTTSELDDLGIEGAKLLAPGAPARSILSRRVHASDAKRMPPLGTRVVDERGAALVDAYIQSLTTCP